LDIHAYPALIAPPTAAAPAETAGDDQAACFFHPSKKAAAHCQSCGRFICSLCELPFGRTVICPLCLESGIREEQFQDLTKRRTLYDYAAFYTAVLPMLFIWPTLITGPLSIILALRYWKRPGSLVQGFRRTRLVAAILIGGLQTAVWALFFYEQVT
jgi:hypothetical protein